MRESGFRSFRTPFFRRAPRCRLAGGFSPLRTVDDGRVARGMIFLQGAARHFREGLVFLGAMKKSNIILAGLLASIFATGCGAAPDEVCGHIEEVVKKEAGDEAATQAVEGCEFKWKMRKDTKGIFQYKELAGCVMDADSLDALSKCK